MNAYFQVKNLRCDVGAFQLSAAFSIASNERIALRGPSGMGKTTLLRSLAGLRRIKGDAHVHLDGRNITHLPPERRNIGYVPQESVLFPEWNALDNVAYGLLARGMKKSRAREKVFPLLERVGLAHLALRTPELFSGGEIQRLSALRALVFVPKLLLLDEPFSSLDVDSREVLAQVLLEFCASQLVPLFFTTHLESDVTLLQATSWPMQENEDKTRRWVGSENQRQS